MSEVWNAPVTDKAIVLRRRTRLQKAVHKPFYGRSRRYCRAQVVGELQHFARLARLIAQGLNFVSVKAEYADHAAGDEIGGVLHRPATQLNHPQAVFKIDGAGKCEGRIFAQTKARGRLTTGDDFWIVDFEPFHRRQTGHIECRLAVDGGV